MFVYNFISLKEKMKQVSVSMELWRAGKKASNKLLPILLTVLLIVQISIGILLFIPKVASALVYVNTSDDIHEGDVGTGITHLQGIARHGSYAYINDTDSLHKYNITGGVLGTQDDDELDPFRDWGAAGDLSDSTIDHLGDVDYYDSYIYTIVKDVSDRSPQYISKWNASDLTLNSISSDIGNGYRTGCAVDGPNNRIYFIDLAIDSGSYYIRTYNLATFAAIPAEDIALDLSDLTAGDQALIHNGAELEGPQGLKKEGDYLYFNTLKDSHPKLWRVRASDGKVLHKLRYIFWEDDDVHRFRTLEGFDFDGDSLWITDSHVNTSHEYVVYLASIGSVDEYDYWYIDNVGGSDTKGASDGSSAYPLKSIKVTGANNSLEKYASPDFLRDSPKIRIVSNGSTQPYREIIRPIKSGTASDNTTLYPATDGDTIYVTGSVDFSEIVSDTKWTESITRAGEYYLTEDDDTTKTSYEVRTMATCSASSWTFGGIISLILRRNGTVGSLTSGQWDWGDNDSLGFSTLYYKPVVGEDMTTVHIEAAQNGEPVIGATNNYVHFKNIYGVLSNTSWKGIVNIYSVSNTIFENIEAHLSETQAGFYIRDGTGNQIINGKTSNTYDGVEFDISGSDLILHNIVSFDNLHYGFLLDNDIIDAYHLIAYNNADRGIYIGLVDDVEVKNSIFWSNTSTDARVNESITNFTADYNNIESPHLSWTTATDSQHDISSDSFFVDVANNDFSLQSTSPAIDSGTNVGLSTDHAGNSIYGIPDIGAYEYQPPYTVGTDDVPTTGSIRIYTDGKYRMKTATTTATTASFNITPVGGTHQATTTQYMDITIDEWLTTGTYNKQWTATSTTGDFLTHATSTIYTIGDLASNTYYTFKLDGTATSTAITGDNCTDGVCLSNSNGVATFTYSGGYSTHIFALDKDVTSPSSFTLSSPSDNSSTSPTPTLAWSASSDTESGLSHYQLYIDSTLNTDSITGTSVTPSLSCGAHTWYIKALDNQGNYTNSNTLNLTVGCGGMTPSMLNIINQNMQDQIKRNSIVVDGNLASNNDINNSNDSNQEVLGKTVEQIRQSEVKKILEQTEVIIENWTSKSVYEKIVNQTNNTINKTQKSIIANFIEFGTNTTEKLGQGERAGVINSFNSAFSKFPETEEDWSDIIKVANGRWPEQINENTENNAKNAFKKIYLRNADINNSHDNAAVTIIAYGLRPNSRNLDSEKNAIRYFRAIYGYDPSSATAWDIVRAIAYSGATR